jgi:hypothetical protein
MGIISLSVLFYQILIAVIIIVCATWGRKALFVAFVLTSLWTLTHVFYPPLMIVQFITIIVSSIYGYKKSARKKE